MSSIEWLNADGEARWLALEEAACQLLRGYFVRWSRLIPIEVHRLAASLDTEVVRVKPFPEGARLIPVPEGFRILVSSGIEPGKYRTAIAHELAHTLFYSRGDTPRRLIPISQEEENFCFDVTRRVLAPRSMLRDMGILHLTDADEIYNVLVEKFRLSRPAAARVMLEDYRLAEGVAGRWSQRGGKWALDRGNAYASPSLSPRQRKPLREVARRFLEEGADPGSDYQLIRKLETSCKSAFIIVTIKSLTPRTPSEHES